MSNSTVNSESSFRPAQELCRKAISQIPTHFGRLVYLASLRDSRTGKYIHETVTNLLGLEDADRMLCHTHHKVFSEWLRCSLAEQKADLDEFLETEEGLTLAECRALAPAGARDVERLLYITDLETVLELIRLAPAGAPEVPGS